MTTDYKPSTRAHVRRKDRAVDDDAWIAGFLARSPFGAMATVHEGQPFINSNIFVYDEQEHAIFMHGARTGRTSTNATAPVRVCFSVSEMGRLLPADTAFSMSVEYAGVVAFGRARLLVDDAERRAALALLLTKYFPHLAEGEDYRRPNDDEMALTSVYRIDIEEWSGKRKVGEPGHPGAFSFPYLPVSDDT